MCKLKSGLLFKNGVFVPDYDSHDMMLKEKGIADTAENRIAGKFVRFELNPPNDDPFLPVDMWQFVIDQDELPEWIESDMKKYESIAREAVKKWAEKHIFIGVAGLSLAEGSGYYLKDCTNVVLAGNAEVYEMRGNSTVQNMRDSSTVQYMRDSATVQNMRENSTVQNMRENSTVQNMRDSSTVQYMWDSSTVQYMRDSATVQNMRENSTVQNMRENSTVQNMRDSSTVQYMWDSSTVQYMRDSATVQIAENFSKGVTAETIILSQNATIKDLRSKTLYAADDWKLSIKEKSDV